MNRYLLVFNTCEIQRNNLFLYIKHLESLLRQVSNGFTYDVVVSGCAMHKATKAGLRKKFGKQIMYCFMDEIQPVNITFNKAIEEIVKRKGRYDGYLYVDSGVDVQNNAAALQLMHDRFVTGNYGIVTLQTDTDMGKENWFGLPKEHVWTGQDFIVPVGKCINLHFNLYSDKVLQYYGRLIPDIFKAYCTESVFSFMVAALNLKWVVVKDLVIFHTKSADGATAGFEHIGDKGYWNNLMFGLDMRDILNDPRARSTGFGYDEWAHIFDHDPSKFDANGFALDSGLGPFMKEKLFLTPERFNYDTYPSETIL